MPMSINPKPLLNDTTPSGYNRTKRQYARIFLWLTSLLLITSHPFLSLPTSACAVYTMHGGTWFSHKNFKWMSASILSFCISLYSLALRVKSDTIDEGFAYELKVSLEVRQRTVEITWGGILLLCLVLTVKNSLDNRMAVGKET
mmetsp:Transcript_13133/g.21582  ORF Transcript_13133/g.21582 Transcript_13133/m.21582 type:complete len:144 (-) Transcript_13133:233-664(-)